MVVGDAVVGDTVVGGTVEVVLGATVVLVVVLVEVVVGGGITKPFAQPQRMSIGAPTGNPTVVA